jgi:predicted porin
MKKLLLCSAAALGVALSAAPAAAQIDVTVGGHSKNYMGYLTQDGSGERKFDMLRESELHINAEGTADNGLVYGFHLEMEVDGEDDGNNDIDESYVYLSSNMGRVNLGSEDGANFLLQVAAPSADSNVDGIRQYINPVNYNLSTDLTGFAGTAIEYANDVTGKAQKVTYLSPVFSGFQVGASYTPDINDAEVTGLSGFNNDTTGLGDAWEGAGRYEGVFNNVGFAVGAGYTHVDDETGGAGRDDLSQWNVGLDLDIGAFGVGAIYTETNSVGGVEDADRDTWVVGADYTTGPFQFGLSYLDGDMEGAGDAGEDVEVQRYTGGVVYTAAPGLTFRGSVSQIQHEVSGGDDFDATSVLGGVQFNF